MGKWHYQIQQFEDKGEVYYMIVEVYSNGARTQNGVCPMGETPEELISELQHMLNDAKKYPFLEKERND